MERRVRNADEAEEVLASLNHFHDAFIKRLLLESTDSFDAKGSQLCTGELTVTILFAHYNFAAAPRPPTQAVEATFAGVKDLDLSLGGRDVEWNVLDLSVRTESRPSDVGQPESCLAAYLTTPRLTPAGEWASRQCRLFTFKEAAIRDIDIA